MAHLAVWNGGEAEILRLVEAVAHNCDCSRGRSDTVRTSGCPAHQMLAFDQRALDGLLFARWLAPQLQDQEWDRSVPSLAITLTATFGPAIRSRGYASSAPRIPPR